MAFPSSMSRASSPGREDVRKMRRHRGPSLTPLFGLSARRQLQRPRPRTKPRIELDRGLAGIADRALDLLKIARGEVVALLQVDAPLGGFARGVGRDRSEFVGKPPDQL